jgi:hypothetical protein
MVGAISRLHSESPAGRAANLVLSLPVSNSGRLELQQGVAQMRHMLFAACIFLVAGVLHAQHGTAPDGYFPIGFAGDMWTGEVSAVNNANREITLVYTGKKKTESFVGVLQQGYRVKLKDGSLAELKFSMIPVGTRLRVYYMAKDRKISGRKEKYYEIFRIDFPPN